MQSTGIRVTSPNVWSLSKFTLSEDECVVQVKHSSICRTDFSILNGELSYYKNGLASYPIVTGHEWCGIYDGEPVVGTCILGCDACKHCWNFYPILCSDRKEVGVVNKDGGHATFISMPQDALLPIPTIDFKYALVEPLAVAIHGIKRIPLSSNDKILVYGYGAIGRMVANVLQIKGYNCSTYDIRDRQAISLANFDVMIECSGFSTGLKDFCHNRGAKILLFGMDYEPMVLNDLVCNEITIYTSLGSTKRDFLEAINMMPYVHFPIRAVFTLSHFDEALMSAKNGIKPIISNTIEDN